MILYLLTVQLKFLKLGALPRSEDRVRGNLRVAFLVFITAVNTHVVQVHAGTSKADFSSRVRPDWRLCRLNEPVLGCLVGGSLN